MGANFFRSHNKNHLVLHLLFCYLRVLPSMNRHQLVLASGHLMMAGSCCALHHALHKAPIVMLIDSLPSFHSVS